MNEMQKLLSLLTEFIELPDEAFNDTTLKQFLDSINTAFDEELVDATVDSFIHEAAANPEIYKLKFEDVLKGLDAICNSYLENTDNEYKQKFITAFFHKIMDFYRETMTRAGIGQYPSILVELCREGAKLPTFAHPTDAGADIYAPEEVVLPPHSTTIVPVGLKLCISSGWLVSLRPRSGMSAKTTVRIANAPATIDEDFHAELGVILDNIGNEPYTIHAGDRIAQMLMEKAYHTNYVACDNISQYYTSDRANESGKAGFGSTGA